MNKNEMKETKKSKKIYCKKCYENLFLQEKQSES